MPGMRDKPKKPARPDAKALPAKPTTDEVVDHGGEESFPASDPVAVSSAHHNAKKREVKEDPTPQRRPPPDWLLNPSRR